MKKEYFLIICISLLILSYVIDYVSGPVSIPLKNPYLFLNQTVISQVPLTAVGVFSRSLGLVLGIILLLSLINKKFFVKASISFFIGAIFSLFSIQQIATNTRTVTIQWSLSFAFAAMALVLPLFVYLILGFVFPVKKIIIPENSDDQKTSD